MRRWHKTEARGGLVAVRKHLRSTALARGTRRARIRKLIGMKFHLGVD